MLALRAEFSCLAFCCCLVFFIRKKVLGAFLCRRKMLHYWHAESRRISLLEKLSSEAKCNFELVKLECDPYQQVHRQKVKMKATIYLGL